MDRPNTDRVRVRRQPERGQYSREEIEAVLDAALVVHVAFVHDGQPICIPTLCARAGDRVLVHGSSASRTLRTLAGGVPACLTATVTDGLVLARSVFEHSVNYRSAVLLGSFARVETDDGRLAAYRAFTEKLLAGRWDEVRPPAPLELRATEILSLPIGEASAKVRTGPPSDDESEDAAPDVWAGVVPAVTGWGEPVPSPGLRAGIDIPESVRRLLDSAHEQV